MHEPNKTTITPDMYDDKEELIQLLSNDICWLNGHINKLYQNVPADTIIAIKKDIRCFLLGIVDHITKE